MRRFDSLKGECSCLEDRSYIQMCYILNFVMAMSCVLQRCLNIRNLGLLEPQQDQITDLFLH